MIFPTGYEASPRANPERQTVALSDFIVASCSPHGLMTHVQLDSGALQCMKCLEEELLHAEMRKHGKDKSSAMLAYPSACVIKQEEDDSLCSDGNPDDYGDSR